MHILVTGGAGFIGSHLVRWLVEQNHQVRVLDNLSSGDVSLLGPARNAVDLIEGDIRDFETVTAAAQGAELIFHLAAMVSVNESIEQPRLAYAHNVMGTLHVLEAARLHTIYRVVQMSSSAIYGNNENLPVSEQEPPEPLSPYASTKLAAEQMGQLYTTLYHMEIVALRGFNIYGPRQSPTSPYAAVIPRFISAFRNGKQPTIFGDGLQTRDFIFVGDVVQALWTASQASGVGGHVFNVGSGKELSVVELARIIGEIMGKDVNPSFAPARKGEVRHSCADVSHFARQAGFTAQMDLHEGLEKTLVEWET